MKKTLLTIALALATLGASAQTLNLSTLTGTNISRFDGAIKDIAMSRSMVTGWNTFSVPFDMTAAQLNELFGSDCRLERLVSVESNGKTIVLNFQDVKSEGVKANVPYILHYTGESKNVAMKFNGVMLHNAASELSFQTSDGITVTMNGANIMTNATNLYGILAKDNAEASFVSVGDLNTRFYATRCFVRLTNIDNEALTSATLVTRHIAEGAATAISTVVADNKQLVDVYNEAGQIVAKGIPASKVNSLAKGLYIVNGSKIQVK